MAHYAFLNNDNEVVEVIYGNDETNTDDLPDGFDSWEAWYGNFRGMTCKRTSYNTLGNQHLDGGTPFRGNYAVVGGSYDPVNDIFHHGQPFESWTLDSNDWIWKPPVPHPNSLDNTDTHPYTWDEANQEWVE